MSDVELLPCPFCGGSVKLEKAAVNPKWPGDDRKWYGVVCRNTINLGGTCAIEQIPSASKEAAIERWNTRAPLSPSGWLKKTLGQAPKVGSRDQGYD